MITTTFYVLYSILVKPVVIVKQLNDVILRGLESLVATFECELSTGVESLPVQWLRNGQPITASDKYDITLSGATCRLDVRDCQTSDEAEYSIRVKDLTSKAHLHIKGKHIGTHLGRM